MQREPTVPRVGVGRVGPEEGHERPIIVSGIATGVSQDPSPWKAGVQAGKTAFEKLGKSKPDFALVLVTGNYELDPVVKGVLQSVGKDVPVIGTKTLGVLFTENQVVTPGVVVAIIKSDSYRIVSSVGRNIHQGLHTALESACLPILDQIRARKAEGYEYLNLFFILDSYVNGDVLVTEIARIVDRYDVNISFYGGILDFEEISKECSINTGTETIVGGIACVGFFSKVPPALGYGHGLHPLVPKRATKVGGNIIYHFDNRPAFEVWKEFLIKKGIPEAQILKNPTQYLGMYQFGVPDPNNPKYPKVRIAVGITREGGIKLAGDVPENSTVWFMEARKERMMDAVNQGVEDAFSKVDQRKPIGAIIMESLHRFASLGNDFYGEISAFQRKVAMPLIGFTTFGEFLRPQPEYKWFHNSSFAVQIFTE
ncbi:MAG: FIST C-terminal domain-containing protein [candidate division WOR-3 bacterium]